MEVGSCPICGEPGGFHGQTKHAEERRAVDMLDALAAEVGTGPVLDEMLESIGQMARGEGRTVRPAELRGEVDDMQDRR